MSTYFLSPLCGAGQQFFSNQGVVLSGGLITTYLGGSVSTPQATYTDSTGTVPRGNPIVLNSAGRVGGEVWQSGGVLVKYVLSDANNNVIDTWDNVAGLNDTSGLYVSSRTATGAGLVLTLNQTVIPLSFSYTQGVNAIQVQLNGAILISGQDYIESSTTTVTLTTGILSTSDSLVIIGSLPTTVTTTVVPATSVVYTPIGGSPTNVSTYLNSGASVIPYTPPSGVPTTVAGKESQIISVWDFMTSAQITDCRSGVTPVIDSSTAISNTVTYAASVGATVFIPGGNYLSNGLNIPSNTYIYGESNSVIYRTNDYGWTPASGANNITIDTIQFNNNAPSVDITHNYCFTVMNLIVTNLVIRNCNFYNGYTGALTHKNNGPDGIYISTFSPTIRNGILIDNCTFTNFVRNGISIVDGANSVLIRNCYFTGCGLRGIDVEADIGSSVQVYDLRIEGCRFVDNGAGSIRGTDVIGGALSILNNTPTSYHSSGVEVIDCYFATPTAVNTLGINYFLIDSTQNFHMRGCNFVTPVSVSNHYVVFESGTQGSQNGLIENNTFTTQVQCFNFTSVHIDNNQFIGALCNLQGGAVGVNHRITNNTFNSCGGGSTSPVLLGAPNSVISGNSFIETRASGTPTSVITFNPAFTAALNTANWQVTNNTVESTSAAFANFIYDYHASTSYQLQGLNISGNYITGCAAGIALAGTNTAGAGGTTANYLDITINNNTFIGLTAIPLNLQVVSRLSFCNNLSRDSATNTITFAIGHSDSYVCSNNIVVDTRTLTARSTYAIAAQNTLAGTPTSLLSSNLSRNTQSGFTIAGAEGTSVNNTVY